MIPIRIISPEPGRIFALRRMVEPPCIGIMEGIAAESSEARIDRLMQSV
jgi:hypothetical protein